MSEYRRLIAYFYEYIEGKKRKNTGFAKVELRNGTWRILFRLTAPVHPRPPVEVYGFVRTGDVLLGLPMGNMRAGREMMEEWAYHDDTLWMGKYRLSDFSGIWIRSGDGRHFITVWDEEPVDVERFVTELPTESKGKTAAAEDSENAREKTELRTVIESEPDVGAEALSGLAEPDVEAAAVPSLSEPDMESEEAAHLPESDAVPEVSYETQKINWMTRASDDQKIWENLYKKSRGFRPFSDQEITACIRVDPEDILQLQRARWRTGRNSFLMHGYYNYHHLMIGKRADGTYVLGVPGVMNPQEKYLAVMFGFPDFKFSDVPEQNPAGGYWYRTLEQEQPEETVS